MSEALEPEITEPEFCPNPKCRYFHREAAAAAAQTSPRWYRRCGCFHTKSRGAIQRFRCLSCGKTCSTQTFSIHYWTHATVDLERLHQDLDSASGLRQIARRWKCCYRVVANRISRLARSALALMDAALSGAVITEDIAIDGFAAFVRSQYFPADINIAVGARSQFLYALSLSALRRSGRMTAVQRRRRAMIDALWRPPKHSVRDGMALVLESLAEPLAYGLPPSPPIGARRICSDEHHSYPHAIASVRLLGVLTEHRRIVPLTVSSRAPRTQANPVFGPNYVDRQIRKNMGEHARQSLKHAREANSMMERLAIFSASHNFFTPHRIVDRVDIAAEPTHADVARLAGRPAVQSVLKRFYTHRHLWGHMGQRAGWMRKIWQHEHENPPAVDFRTGKPSKTVVALAAGVMPAHLAA